MEIRRSSHSVRSSGGGKPSCGRGREKSLGRLPQKAVRWDYTENLAGMLPAGGDRVLEGGSHPEGGDGRFWGGARWSPINRKGKPQTKMLKGGVKKKEQPPIWSTGEKYYAIEAVSVRLKSRLPGAYGRREVGTPPEKEGSTVVPGNASLMNAQEKNSLSRKGAPKKRKAGDP